MKLLAAALGLLLPLAACGGSSDLTITAGEVVVGGGDVEYVLDRRGAFHATWMVFGGASFDRRDGIASFVLSGLDMDAARPIHARYPDFHRCDSPGAALAKDAIEHPRIVPADGEVAGALQDVLAEHEASLAAGADRVSVLLEGSHLELATATVGGEDVTAELPDELRGAYLLVRSARLVDTRSALEGDGTR